MEQKLTESQACITSPAKWSPFLPESSPGTRTTGTLWSIVQISVSYHGTYSFLSLLSSEGQAVNPTCSHILPRLSKQEQLSQSSPSPGYSIFAWLEQDILQACSSQSWADLFKRDPRSQGSPVQGMLLVLTATVATFMEAIWQEQSKTVLLLNLTILSEASRNKGHLIIESLLCYL